ncbi:Phosphoserine phosphatase SerB1 [bacterium HR23]|nr:Phosphoserine phosphatase SerB1 [bacterium HR23]
MQAVAFFDFDGTLCTGQVWSGLGRWADAYRRRRATYRWSLRLLPGLYWPLYRLRLLPEGAFFNAWGNGVARFFRGMPYGEARSICQWVAERHLLPTLRGDVVERLHAHQARGEGVVLVSGTLQEAVEEVARHLGVSTVLATPLQVRNGICTGRLEGPFLYGHLKAQRVRRFAEEHNPPLDLSRCWAYADRRWDIPFLEAVGRPVAVYPDRVLLAYAERKGWEVLGRR